MGNSTAPTRLLLLTWSMRVNAYNSRVMMNELYWCYSRAPSSSGDMLCVNGKTVFIEIDQSKHWISMGRPAAVNSVYLLLTHPMNDSCGVAAVVVLLLGSSYIVKDCADASNELMCV